LLYGTQGGEAFRAPIPNQITLNLVFFLLKKENRKISKRSRLSKEGTAKEKKNLFSRHLPSQLLFLQ
jgi:hypothetical protein